MKKKSLLKIKQIYFFLGFISLLFFLTGCSENQSIVNNVEEKEANEIVVFLASKGIVSQKIKSSTSQTPGNASSTLMWDIYVAPENLVKAMALLNKQGLPRRKGITLLDLFAKDKLMSSEKEETIKYQAGLEEELKNIIRKIDGVIDADVQISFPSAEILPGTTPQKAKASVYIKHQGVFDDPNNHLESKIKRLLAGAVENLNFEDVAVIADRSNLSDITINGEYDLISKTAREKEYISIWSVIMTKGSAKTFRFILFTLIVIILAFSGIIAYLIYKFYPFWQKEKENLKKEKQ